MPLNFEGLIVPNVSWKVRNSASPARDFESAAMAMDWNASGHVQRARFAFGGVAETPLRVAEDEEAVTGQFWNEGALARVQAILDRRLAPITDARGSKEYRLQVSKSLVERFWWEHRS